MELSERMAKFTNTSPGQGPHGDCHEWTGGKIKGYGTIKVERKPKHATHVAWFLRHGVWPTNLMLHTCDNPPCVRVEHLYDGTHADNAQDRERRGRRNRPTGERHGGSRVTDAQAAEIVQLCVAGWKQADIAAAYGVSQPWVSRLSRGLRRAVSTEGAAA